MVWYGMMRYVKVRYVMVWYDKLCCGTLWYSKV